MSEDTTAKMRTGATGGRTVRRCGRSEECAFAGETVDLTRMTASEIITWYADYKVAEYWRTLSGDESAVPPRAANKVPFRRTG